MQSQLFPLHVRDQRGAGDKSWALFIDPVGSITFAVKRHGGCLRFFRPRCWHVDRWRGCLSATLCYRHLIAIDFLLLYRSLWILPPSQTPQSALRTLKLKLHLSAGSASVFDTSEPRLGVTPALSARLCSAARSAGTVEKVKVVSRQLIVLMETSTQRLKAKYNKTCFHPQWEAVREKRLKHLNRYSMDSDN